MHAPCLARAFFPPLPRFRIRLCLCLFLLCAIHPSAMGGIFIHSVSIYRYDAVVHDDDERVRRGLLRLLGQPRMHYWGLIDQLLFMEQAL